jgi:hypothetical protein
MVLKKTIRLAEVTILPVQMAENIKRGVTGSGTLYILIIPGSEFIIGTVTRTF